MRENDEVRMTNDEIESLLCSFEPNALHVDRDALMYRAGYAAACGPAARGSHVRLWQSTTAVMTAATVALAVMLARDETRSAPAVAEVDVPVHPERSVDEQQVVVAAAPSPAPPVEQNDEQQARKRQSSPLLLADPSSNYLALRAAVLHRGVETWPTDYREPAIDYPGGELHRTSTVRNLMQEVLPSVPQPREDDHPQPTDASTTDEETIV